MEDQIKSLYRSKLGRDPDATELASEVENAGKYGLGQLESNLGERAAPTDGRTFDSQSPYYDTNTHQLNAAGQQEAQRIGRTPTERDNQASSPRDTALQQVSQVYTSTPTPDAGATAGGAAGAGSFRDILMGQLGALSGPVSPDDPALQHIFAAQRLSSQREADRARAVAAERRAAQGLGDSGALDTDIRGVDEDRAERNLSMQADTMDSEMRDRRRALAALLGLGLQDENTDNALAQQGSQFDRTLAQNDEHFDANLGFNYAGLNQQDSHFNDQQGYNWAALEQSGNLQALLALLSGA